MSPEASGRKYVAVACKRYRMMFPRTLGFHALACTSEFTSSKRVVAFSLFSSAVQTFILFYLNHQIQAKHHLRTDVYSALQVSIVS